MNKCDCPVCAHWRVYWRGLRILLLVVLAGCAADVERDVPLGEFFERRAVASCTKVAECSGTDVDACMADLEILMRSMNRVTGWPVDRSESALAECEDWIAGAVCWSNEGYPSPWDVPECDFGGVR